MRFVSGATVTDMDINIESKDKIEVSDLPKINPLKLPQTMHEIVDAINQIPPVPEYYSERKENR